MNESKYEVKVALPKGVGILDGGDAFLAPSDQEILDGCDDFKPVSAASTKDVAESIRVGRAVRAKQKQCWFNARRAILKLEDYSTASLIEGWALLLKYWLPIEHGWIVRGGAIIDPTLPDAEMTYFPGLEFRGRDGVNAFLGAPEGKKCRRSPFFHAFGWGGYHSPHFRKCSEDVMKAIGIDPLQAGSSPDKGVTA